jgi:hypothetical protein
MSPGFASSLISLREIPSVSGTGDAVGTWSNNHSADRSRRRCALRSEIKKEAAGRVTFAEQRTPSA